jgi:hypothetical protein
VDNSIQLTHPVKWGNELINVLVFREVIAKDLRSIKLNSMQFGDILDLAAKLSGHPPSVLDQLSMADVGRVVENVGERLNLGV